jgi:hypothetical protein
MLQNRIIETIKFFDLQGLPLTALEVYKYLIVGEDSLRARLNSTFELAELGEPAAPIGFDTVLFELDDLTEKKLIERRIGYYSIPGRAHLITERMRSASFGIKRERKIKRIAWLLKYIPFVRGVGINGSQAFGPQKERSDIDLLILTDSDFLWTARTFVTAFFQFVGMRRHGKKIANKFCLNHYIAGIKHLDHGRNVYTAQEYIKLRPIAYAPAVQQFKMANSDWLFRIFPNAARVTAFGLREEISSVLQQTLEKVYKALFGMRIEEWLARWQMPRIKQEKYIVVAGDELSFHPHSKQEELLQKFFH